MAANDEELCEAISERIKRDFGIQVPIEVIDDLMIEMQRENLKRLISQAFLAIATERQEVAEKQNQEAQKE